ncbi:MAG: TlyA family RNA methyltransferase [Acidobacteria bacterium]|nr:TlyA family RNA methyltransferase [Acidobacteriota bacterium]
MTKSQVPNSKPRRHRLDQWLVDHHLAESRHKAQALILAGQVLVNEQRAEKPGQLVPEQAQVRIRGEAMRYVGRGGLKLEGALRTFGLVVEQAVCLDVGASTGGFTDCLLQHGATRVYAIDVGTNQLAWKLRNSPQVIVREQVNARYLQPSDFPELFDVVTCDVSFISQDKILPAVALLMKPGALLITLVKPQFEVGREDVGKKGIVKDPALHRRAIEKVAQVAQVAGIQPWHVMCSPIEGADGNREFLLIGKRQAAEGLDGFPEVDLTLWQAELQALFRNE